MKPILDQWTLLTRRLRAAPHRFLLCDFDGTLVPFQSRPEHVWLPRTVGRDLEALARRPGWTVGLVSGRSLQDLRQRARIPGVYLIGNHGYEIERDRDVFVHPAAAAKMALLRSLARDITEAIAGLRGAWVEDKQCTLSLHFRQVPRNRIPDLKARVRALLRQRTLPRSLDVREGNCVLEIRPESSWHKGSVVTRLRRSRLPTSCVLYLGDDATDEDVFRLLKRSDFGIRVGGGQQPTKACYSLRHPAEAVRFVHRLRAWDEEGSVDA